MTVRVAAYTVERLAPGSYDVLLDGSLVAALVREVDSSGSAREWVIDLLDEMPSPDRPTPFTAQRHTFTTLAVALEWLGIRDEAAGVEVLNHGRPDVRLRGPEA